MVGLEHWLNMAMIGVGALPQLSDAQRKAAMAGIQGAIAVVKAKEADTNKMDRLQKNWIKYAKKLEKKKDVENDYRIALLKQKIRADLILADPKHQPPDGNTVALLAEGAVAVAKIEG